VLVAGGFNNPNGAELYDPDTETWRITARLTVARELHTATLLKNGSVLVVGGFGGSLPLNSAEVYDPVTETWTGSAAPRITSATVSGKKLFVFGDDFDPGAVILLNGNEQTTKTDPQNPQTSLIGKKAGLQIKAGDKLRVRNPGGSLSEEFTFTGLSQRSHGNAAA
jgi:hypothetical protein